MIILCILFSPFIPSNRYMIVMAIPLVFHLSFPFFFVLSSSEKSSVHQKIRKSGDRVIRRFWFSGVLPNNPRAQRNVLESVWNAAPRPSRAIWQFQAHRHQCRNTSNKLFSGQTQMLPINVSNKAVLEPTGAFVLPGLNKYKQRENKCDTGEI